MARDPVGELERIPERAGALGWERAEHLQRVQERPPPLARTLDLLPAAERDVAEAVAAARRRPADRHSDALGDVGLAPGARAERHRRGRVEHEPRRQDALRELHAHVRGAGSSWR